MAVKVQVGWEYVSLSEHAIERWGERIRPGLEREQLVKEIRGILAGATLTREVPAWTHDAPVILDASGVRVSAARWIVVSDDICLPVSPNGIAVTTLLRGALSEPDRQRKNAERDRQTRYRHGRPQRSRAREKARRQARNEGWGGGWSNV